MIHKNNTYGNKLKILILFSNFQSWVYLAIYVLLPHCDNATQANK